MHAVRCRILLFEGGGISICLSIRIYQTNKSNIINQCSKPWKVHEDGLDTENILEGRA